MIAIDNMFAIKYFLHSREVFLIESPSASSISGGDFIE